MGFTNRGVEFLFIFDNVGHSFVVCPKCLHKGHGWLTLGGGVVLGRTWVLNFGYFVPPMLGLVTNGGGFVTCGANLVGGPYGMHVGDTIINP